MGKERKKNSYASQNKNKKKNIEEKTTVEKVTKANKKIDDKKNTKKYEKEVIEEASKKVIDAVDEDFDLDEDIDLEDDEDFEDEDEDIEVDDEDDTEDEDEDVEVDDEDDTEDEDEDIELDDEDDTVDEDEDIEVDDEDDTEDEDEDIEVDDEDDTEDEDEDIEVDDEEDEAPKIQQVEFNKKEKKNIERIEKIAKEKKKKTKSGHSGFSKFLLFLDTYHLQIYAFVAGVLITVFVAMLIWPDRIATLKDGTQPVVKVNKKTYTADDLYENMKGYYSVSLLLDQIDSDILTKLYPEDEAMTKKINENAEYYLNMYKQYYNYTQEEFLEKNGFSSYDAFLDYLRLDYRRNQYLDDYVEDGLTDSEIQKYYDSNVFGDINTQHVLVEVRSNNEDESKLSDEDAKKLAEEIITKLNDGTSWENIQKDYKDKITYEDLGYQAWDASLEESFMKALKDMEDNSYSKEPVKTSYGYHVIYRLDQKKKPTLKKAKETVIKKLVTEKKSNDSNLLYKSLISLREEKKISFSDTVMKSKYETYCKQYK